MATPEPDCSIVKLSRMSRSFSRSQTPGATTSTAVVKAIPNQYAGYRRMTRETKNSRGVRPQQDMQITKPLITKKISTPIQP